MLARRSCTAGHEGRQQITRVILKYVSDTGPLINSQGYPRFVTMRIYIMSQKLWFEGGVIPKALVGILEEVGNGEEITYETHSVENYDEDENE